MKADSLYQIESLTDVQRAELISIAGGDFEVDYDDEPDDDVFEYLKISAEYVRDSRTPEEAKAPPPRWFDEIPGFSEKPKR